ncbi:MAG: NAD-binding protein [Dehalococcoidia bacterium]
MNVIIVGCGRMGASLAGSLSDAGHIVTVVEVRRRNIANLPRNRVDSASVNIVEGDGAAADVLETAGIDSADLLIAVTGRDTLNGLIAQKARTMYRVKTVMVRVKDEDLRRLYETFGVVTVNSTHIVAERMLAGIMEIQ